MSETLSRELYFKTNRRKVSLPLCSKYLPARTNEIAVGKVKGNTENVTKHISTFAF